MLFFPIGPPTKVVIEKIAENEAQLKKIILYRIYDENTIDNNSNINVNISFYRENISSLSSKKYEINWEKEFNTYIDVISKNQLSPMKINSLSLKASIMNEVCGTITEIVQ